MDVKTKLYAVFVTFTRMQAHPHKGTHTHTHKDHLSPVSGQRMGGLGGVHCPISSSEKRILFQVVGPAEKRVCACVCVRFSLYLHLSQSC